MIFYRVLVSYKCLTSYGEYRCVTRGLISGHKAHRSHSACKCRPLMRVRQGADDFCNVLEVGAYVAFHCDVPQPLALLGQGNQEGISTQRTDKWFGEVQKCREVQKMTNIYKKDQNT